MQISIIKTIPELSHLDGRVYVHLPTREIANRFLMHAAEEGLAFADGVNPTDRCATEVMAINPNHTINFVGATGHMAYEAASKTVGGQFLIRMEYTGSVFVPYNTHEE